MTILKPIHGTIEVDKSRGVIWINTCDGICVLRICQINFVNYEEKFGFIDVTKEKAFMIKDSGLEEESKVSNFLNSVVEVISEKLPGLPDEEQEEYLSKLLTKLREEK